MYDFPQSQAIHDEFWSALRTRLIEAGVTEAPERLTRGMHHEEVWTHPSLLFGQACEYPLAKFYAGRVRLVATPRYGVPGCVAGAYRSAIVVRERDPAEALAELRGRRCVINERTSNSGMNVLRASIAPLADGKPFFESVHLSGSHRKSVQMISAGEADVSAVDCVTFAHLQRLEPAIVAPLRILSWTAASPSLPFITSSSTSDRMLAGLRDALAAVIVDSTLSAVRQQLFLEGVDLSPAEGFSEVLRLERFAGQSGYPELI